MSEIPRWINPLAYDDAHPVPAPKYTFDRENHIHMLDGRPLHGTSTVVGILSKELAYWAAGMALTPLGWLNKNKSTTRERVLAAASGQQKVALMNPDEYRDFLEECYRAHNTKKETTAVVGTDMHAELEKYVRACIYDNKGQSFDAFEGPGLDVPEVFRFRAWAYNHVAEFLWSEAHCYSERLWLGGICDCGAILKNGKVAILDFKSSKESFYGYFVQMAGYAIAIRENGLFTFEGKPIAVQLSRIQMNPVVDVLASLPFGSPDTYKFPVLPADRFTLEFEGALWNYKAKQWCDAELKKINPPKVKYKSKK